MMEEGLDCPRLASVEDEETNVEANEEQVQGGFQGVSWLYDNMMATTW